MSVLRDGRLIMGWDVQRGAATCAISVAEYTDMEADTAWDSPTPWYALEAMERRGLKVIRNRDGIPTHVIAPEEDESMLELELPYRAVQSLRRIEKAGDFGMSIHEARVENIGYSLLIDRNLCEVGAVYTTAVFEGHTVRRLDARARRIRASRLGKAYLGLWDRKNKEAQSA